MLESWKMHLTALLLSLMVICSGYGLCDRVKRHLVFTKGSKFFVRYNVRENLLQSTSIFAHASGFKLTWDLPDKVDRKHGRRRIRRKDIYQGIQNIFAQNEMDGWECLKTFLCETKLILKDNRDFVSRLLNIIFTPDEEDIRNGLGTVMDNCGKEIYTCPITLLSFVTGSN